MSRIFLRGRPKVLRVDVNLCTGCRSCVMACSLIKEGVFSPTKSRIQILTNESKCLSIPTLCEHCTDPPCIPACPVNAISQDKITGIAKVNKKICTGCGMCKEVCPYDSIKIRDGKVYKCDLCGGDPECVKVCYANALQYVEKQPATVRNKEILAEKRVRALGDIKSEFSE